MFASEYFLQQMMLLLVMVKHTPIFNIFIPTFLHCVIQKLIELAYVERIKLVIEVIIVGKKIRVSFGSSYRALF